MFFPRKLSATNDDEEGVRGWLGNVGPGWVWIVLTENQLNVYILCIINTPERRQLNISLGVFFSLVWRINKHRHPKSQTCILFTTRWCCLLSSVKNRSYLLGWMDGEGGLDSEAPIFCRNVKSINTRKWNHSFEFEFEEKALVTSLPVSENAGLLCDFRNGDFLPKDGQVSTRA